MRCHINVSWPLSSSWLYKVDIYMNIFVAQTRLSNKNRTRKTTKKLIILIWRQVIKKYKSCWRNFLMLCLKQMRIQIKRKGTILPMFANDIWRSPRSQTVISYAVPHSLPTSTCLKRFQKFKLQRNGILTTVIKPTKHSQWLTNLRVTWKSFSVS